MASLDASKYCECGEETIIVPGHDKCRYCLGVHEMDSCQACKSLSMTKRASWKRDIRDASKAGYWMFPTGGRCKPFPPIPAKGVTVPSTGSVVRDNPAESASEVALRQAEKDADSYFEALPSEASKERHPSSSHGDVSPQSRSGTEPPEEDRIPPHTMAIYAQLWGVSMREAERLAADPTVRKTMRPIRIPDMDEVPRSPREHQSRKRASSPSVTEEIST